MANQTLFMYQGDGDFQQHSVVTVDGKQAKQLTEAGKAVEVSLGDYDSYRQQVKDAHKTYGKARERIKESDHPSVTDEIRDYEIKQAYKTFEQAAKQAQDEWTVKRQEMQAEAKAKAARATVNVSQREKQTSEQVASRIALNIAQATNASQLSAAIRQGSDDIRYLNDAEKTALQGELMGVLSQVDAKNEKFDSTVSSRSLVSSTQDVRNMDLLAGKVADQIPNRVDLEYRRVKTVKEGLGVVPKSL
ncbi:hypothetical protein [Halobacillus seohaensis]|uniref:Uncharacterized protein n=1 Tax=Halobacillus seohaensis TaxID=447421 RepID=A0ABW2EPH6_9BACI